MRLSVLFSFAGTLMMFAKPVYSQNSLVTINEENTQIVNIIDEIENQTDYLFIYNDRVDVSQTVTLHMKKEPVKRVLDELFVDTDIVYNVKDNHIILSQTESMSSPVASSKTAPQVTPTVKGTVLDASGEPLIAAAVQIQGTRTGVMTDIDGNFSIEAEAGQTLLVSCLGYVSKTIAVVSGQTTYQIVLDEDSEQLEELVVIGYGTVKKSDLTGSVASVAEEEITKAATSDVISSLQGRAAGVQIITNSGNPSATSEIKIRGTGSPNGSAPLYVVDGFPMNDINYLSPNDIASIEILKDASACAIYGSRGANGVVMITTKQAAAGNIKVDIKAEYGLESAPAKPQMLSSSQYAEMTNLAMQNMGKAATYANPNNMPYDTDWFNEVMQTGKYQNYSMTLSGGSDKISHIFTANYFSREGTVKSTKFDRINLNMSGQYKPFKFLTLKANVSGAFSKTNSLGANGTNNNSVFMSSLIAPPDIPIWNDVTNYYTGITVFRLANPVGALSRNYGKSNSNYLIGNFSADLKILKDLTFTSRFGYKYNIGLSSGFTPIYFETSNIASGNTATSRSTSFSTDWTWENMLTYSKKFNENHELSVMAAMSARDFYSESYSGSKKYLASPEEEFRYFDAASDTAPSLSGSASALGMLSYLGRINYNLMNRYLLTASFRADGSSRFIGSKKWGYFPSWAFAWKLSEEPFFKNWNQDFIDVVKVRLGWGQIGNERISGYYPYQTNITQNHYYNLGEDKVRTNGAYPGTPGNAELQWETSEQSNVGIDLAFLNNRLTATVDAYIRKTDNILLNETVPRVSGASSLTRNVGGMQNKGLEITLGWKDDIGEFSYSIDGNVSFVKNEVTNLGTSGVLQSTFGYDNALIDMQSQFSNIIRSYPGNPYGQFYGYEFLGIFQNQAEIDNHKSSNGTVIQPDAKPGDSKFADINDDGKIAAKDDMVLIGDPNPVAVFGLNFNASWKNFDLSMLFQGTAGNDIYNASKYYFEKFDGRQNVLARSYKAGWSGEGSTNSVPIVLADAAGGSARNNLNWSSSTMYIEDGSYFRLKNIQLGYTFNPDFNAFKAGFRVYVSAQNLFTITKYSGFDPELSGNGIDRGQYPQPRTFVLGLNINL